jgi:rare lipoprotein A
MRALDAARICASLFLALAVVACSSTARRYPPAPPPSAPSPPPKPPAAKPAPAPAPAKRPASKPSAPAPKPAPPITERGRYEYETDGPPDPKDIPPWLTTQPDPVPRDEPRSAWGNPEEYEVDGIVYRVMPDAKSYREVGLASWYGTKFHGHRTSSGETYDMFRLTAAHKQLPIPTFLRVTNLANHKSVIVRVNDRGPFKDERILDLSYAAAAKLEMLGKVGMVEIEALVPGTLSSPPPKLVAANVPGKPRLLQVAAYSDPKNAILMREKLRELGIQDVLIRDGRMNNGDRVQRVMVGPFNERQKLDEMRARIRGSGYEAFYVTE